MNVIKSLTDVVSFLQKSDNIDMVKKMIDIQTQIIGIQEQLQLLKEENKSLKDINKLKKSIVRYSNDNIISLKSDKDKIFYCSKCWDDEQKLIQVATDNSRYDCPKCKNGKWLFGKEPVYESNYENII